MTSTKPSGSPFVAEDEIAVVFVHGVEVRDPSYASNAIRLLRQELVKATGDRSVGTRVHIQSVYWKPAVADQEDRLVERAFPSRFTTWVRWLNGLVHRVNNGSNAALLPLAATGLLRSVPGLATSNWPTLRWAVTYFVGDAIAYQTTASDSTIYDEIHGRFEEALRAVAARNASAPLCVIAHSLGTVIASDHFYDIQNGLRPTGKTPLEAGQTLTWFYTLGSPIALWMVRHPGLDKPIRIPARESDDVALRSSAQWVNFYDPDDIIAYPLRDLSEEYAKAVNEDRPVRVGPAPLSATPVSHVAYWNDRSVMRPIAQRLATMLTSSAGSASAGRTRG